MEYDNIKILDSGCNYSVMSTLYHRDVGSDIILSHTLGNIDTASDESMIKSTGIMIRIPAVQAPDANIKVISARQFCDERNTFITFLQDGATELHLNPDRIREIAIKINLVLITSNVNHDKLYEIRNRTKIIYKHHHNDMRNPKSYALFIEVQNSVNSRCDEIPRSLGSSLT